MAKMFLSRSSQSRVATRFAFVNWPGSNKREGVSPRNLMSQIPVTMPTKWLKPPVRYVKDLPPGTKAWIHWIDLLVDPHGKSFVDRETALQLANPAFHVMVEMNTDSTGLIVTVDGSDNWSFRQDKEIPPNAFPVVELRERTWNRERSTWNENPAE